jgi:hypothetical protein
MLCFSLLRRICKVLCLLYIRTVRNSPLPSFFLSLSLRCPLSLSLSFSLSLSLSLSLSFSLSHSHSLSSVLSHSLLVLLLRLLCRLQPFWCKEQAVAVQEQRAPKCAAAKATCYQKQRERKGEEGRDLFPSLFTVGLLLVEQRKTGLPNPSLEMCLRLSFTPGLHINERESERALRSFISPRGHFSAKLATDAVATTRDALPSQT